MKPKHIKNLLLTEIKTVSIDFDRYCYEPQRNFSRNRKLSFETVIKSIIGMESKSLTNELLDFFNSSPDTPSASAFIQQRSKIKPEALETIFKGFTNKILKQPLTDLPVLAIDGSDIQIATNPNDETSYFPGANGQKPYNLLHLKQFHYF